MGWLFSWLPLWVAYLPAVALSPIYYLHFNPARYGTRLAMARMGLQLPGWRGLFAYANYALTLVDRYYIQAGRRTVSVEGPDGTAASLAPLEDFLRKADRLVLLGSHCGALELAAPAMEAAGRRVRAVAVADPGAALLLRGVGDVSEGVGVASRTIVADGTMESGLRMLGALRDGDALSFKADRVLPGNEDKSDPVDLFGTSVPLPRGPFEVARLGKASIVSLDVFRVGPCRFRILFEVLTASARDHDVPAALVAYASALERRIARYPHHWFNFFPYWPEDEEALAHHHQTVPPWMRVGVRTLGASLLCGLILAALSHSAPGTPGLPWWVGDWRAGGAIALASGAFAGLLGGLWGAASDRWGRWNPQAWVTGLLGPVFVVAPVFLPPALASPALKAAAVAALVLGWLALWRPRFGAPGSFGIRPTESAAIPGP